MFIDGLIVLFCVIVMWLGLIWKWDFIFVNKIFLLVIWLSRFIIEIVFNNFVKVGVFWMWILLMIVCLLNLFLFSGFKFNCNVFLFVLCKNFVDCNILFVLVDNIWIVLCLFMGVKDFDIVVLLFICVWNLFCMLLFVRNELLKLVRLIVLDMCMWDRFVRIGVWLLFVLFVFGRFCRFKVLDVNLIFGVICLGWLVSFVDLLN